MSLPDWSELLVRGAGLLALACALQLALRKRSASLRHAAWCFAFAALLALPLVPLLVPAIEVDALPFEAPSVAAGSAGPAAEPTPADPEVPLATPSPSSSPLGWSRILFGAWLTGAALLLAQHLLRRLALERIARRGTPLESQAWRARARLAASAVGMRRAVRLVASAEVPVPLALGQSTILLPACALEWDDACLASVLRHELVHLRRRDERRLDHVPGPHRSLSETRALRGARDGHAHGTR